MIYNFPKNLNKKFDNSVLKKSVNIINENSHSDEIEISPFEPISTARAEINHNEHTSSNVGRIVTSPYKSISTSFTRENAGNEAVLMATKQLLSGSTETCNFKSNVQSLNKSYCSDDCEFVVTADKTVNNQVRDSSYSKAEIAKSVKVKQEEATVQVKQQSLRNTKFSFEEDQFLKQGLTKYGKGHWAAILKDKNFKFHSTRTRDSLRMRADSAAFKRQASKMVCEVID